MQDHPAVRACYTCPMCYGRKPQGLVVCWDCYNRYAMRFGNAMCDAALDLAEEQLTPNQG